MATQQPELLPILKALREYITKEYGVNYPPHVRGEDASAKDVPSDWVDKLNPITGGESEGRAEYGSAGGNSTKGASQGEDPYIHKSELTQILEDFAKHVVDGQSVQTTGSRGDNAGLAYPGEGDRVPQNRGLEMQDDEEEEDVEVEDEDVEKHHEDMMKDDEEDEDIDEEDEDIEKGGYDMALSSDSGDVNAILKDIKDLMVARSNEKKEFSELRKELASVKKSVSKEINSGIRKGLKGFGMKPARSEMQTRTQGDSILGTPEPVSSNVAPDQRIGVEGESFAKADEVDVQDQFSTDIEQVLGNDATEDFRSTFKRINGMRNQTGELTPQTLYYYPKKGGAR
jgi:hypothetical protein